MNTLDKIVSGTMTELQNRQYEAGVGMVESIARKILRDIKMHQKIVMRDISKMTRLDLCVFMGNKTLAQAVWDEAQSRSKILNGIK